MYINHDRARIVFDTLVRALKQKEFPYNSSDTPQAIVGKSLEKYSDSQRALFWFYLCMYMRGPVKSNYAAAKLFEIFEDQNGGGIFDPHSPSSQESESIDGIMTRFGFTRLLRDVKKFWVQCSQRLAESYNGDPRMIYTNVSSFDEIERRIRYVRKASSGFMGFQKKMASMLTYFLRDQGLIHLDSFPPPVDFHLMRVMILTGVVVLDDDEPRKFRYETSHLFGYEAVEHYLETTDTDPIELGDALWLLSGNLCNLSPKNAELRAFGVFCEETIAKAPPSKKKRLIAHPGLPFDNIERVKVHSLGYAMQSSCGRCPVQEFCRGGIPATEYYNYGLLQLREGI